MKFNAGPNKQSQEIIFSKKKTVSIHLIVYFNNTRVNSMEAQKKYLTLN